MDLKTMIKYILYTIPFFFLIGCTNVIINNESINRINLILNYQIILIITKMLRIKPTVSGSAMIVSNTASANVKYWYVVTLS